MITFIIGNGFDLNLGMKTSYLDVYNSYVKSQPQNDILKAFRSEISSNYTKWSDFEMGMADYAQHFKNEEDFIMCVRDFKEHLQRYLLEEQDKCIQTRLSDNSKWGFAYELYRSIDTFYKCTTKNAENKIKKAITNNNINFITFNYTYSLEYIVDLYKKYYKNNYEYRLNTPIHIHGTLNDDGVMGVDNVNQFKYLPFNITPKLQRAFVKPYFNVDYDINRVLNVKNTIAQSNVIYSFGWSMGESDKTWVTAIKNWLLKDENHHFICYYYEQTQYLKFNADEILDREIELKEELFLKFNFTEEEKSEVYNRIHLPISHKIFDFKNRDITIRPISTETIR